MTPEFEQVVGEMPILAGYDCRVLMALDKAVAYY